MKSFAQKLFAISFAIALTAGCASVTDAGADQPAKPKISQPGQTAGGEDFTPIYDKPE